MPGKLFVIGVGPGDPELITLKAARILAEADVIAVPEKDGGPGLAYRTAEKAVPEIRCKQILPVSFPMTTDQRTLAEAHDKAASEIETLLRKGLSVALITIGDPMLYSTSAYVIDRINSGNHSVEVISGIPSFCGAAARLMLPLAVGDEPVSICTPEDADFDRRGTTVVLKVWKKLKVLKQKITGTGRDVYLIENCGMPDEKVFRGLENIPETAGYLSILIVK